MTQTPEQIAALLNDGQKRALKVMSGEYKKLPRGHGYPARTMTTGFRLTEWKYVFPELKGARFFRLTPLGQQVRAILKEQTP